MHTLSILFIIIFLFPLFLFIINKFYYFILLTIQYFNQVSFKLPEFHYYFQFSQIFPKTMYKPYFKNCL